MKTTLTAALSAVILMAGSGSAHEIMLTPTRTETTLSVAIDSSHIFVVPGELENTDNLTATLITPDGASDVSIISGGDLTLTAETDMPEGPAWFVAHRLALTYSNTPDGLVEGGRDVNPEANDVRLYEKFSKALIAGGIETFVTAPLGHPLEVVPMSDPAAMSAGDELMVQVLFNGEPLPAASVEATYAGYSEEEMAFVSTSQADADGMANVELTQPGIWYIRVAYDADATQEGIDRHILRAITSFDVE